MNLIEFNSNTAAIPQEILDTTIYEIFEKVRIQIKPKPKISVPEWAEKYRYLSPEDSKKALLGDPKWTYEGFQYLKALGEAFSNPKVREISVMKSGQTGFTQELLNCIGWAIDNAPGPMLVLYPTETNAERFSKRKLEPMLRDTPQMHGKVSDPAKRDGNNSTLEKTFPGGFVSIISAKSVNNLSMQSIMYLLIDEFDRIDRVAGAEGDTVEIVSKRLQGFREISKQVNISTPTVAGSSRIAEKYGLSNQSQLWLPCPSCGKMQVLKWAQVKGWRISKGVYRPEDTFYECEHCCAELSERDKYVMLREGEWIAQKPEIVNHVGLHVSELYSTLSTWGDVVEQFIRAKGNQFKFQTWVNLVLGETYESNEASIPDDVILKRREEFDISRIPEQAFFLTASGDFQKDRAEIGIMGWGENEESWWLEHKVFYGNPESVYSTDENNLYFRIEEYLDSKFLHESGVYLRIQSCGLDTGYATTHVQKFVKLMHKKGKSWIFALQGDRGLLGAPLINRGTINNKLKVRQFSVGTFTAKSIIFTRLALEEFGPGYIHIPSWADDEFAKQLVSEKKIPKYEKGVIVGEKWVKVRSRNEILDITVYNVAALEYANVNLGLAGRNFSMKIQKMKSEAEKNAGVEVDEQNEVRGRSLKRKIKITKRNYVREF